jgi:hypothetical protein
MWEPPEDPVTFCADNPAECVCDAFGENCEPVMPDFAGEIAAYHDDGIGYGVLANLEGISAACKEAGGLDCPSLADLVDQFKSGVGLGELYKDCEGCDLQHGIGWIKKAIKCAEDSSSGACKDKDVKPENANVNNAVGNENSNKNKNKENNGKAKGKNK